MEYTEEQWSSTALAAEGPSPDFIRAVADFLETDPEDILAELGYVHSEDLEQVAAGDLS